MLNITFIGASLPECAFQGRSEACEQFRLVTWWARGALGAAVLVLKEDGGCAAAAQSLPAT